MARRGRQYLCSLCKQPRIPVSEEQSDVLVCGRCDLVMLDESQPNMTEGARTKQDEQ